METAAPFRHWINLRESGFYRCPEVCCHTIFLRYNRGSKRSICYLTGGGVPYCHENGTLENLDNSADLAVREIDTMFNARIWTILIESFPKILIPGLVRTIPLTAIAFSLAMVIAVAVALAQFAKLRGVRQLCRFYIWVIRGTPLLVQLFVVFFGLPHVGVVIDPFPAAVAVFAVNEGAYAAEIIRAALESVPGGQMEAGYCVGISYLQIVRRIVLPQALRTAFPSLANSLIAMVKDTSLASVVTVAEMMMATKQLNALYYEPLALYLETAAIYLLFCTVLTKVQSWGERRLSTYARKGAV